jgi:hypothetical protein
MKHVSATKSSNKLILLTKRRASLNAIQECGRAMLTTFRAGMEYGWLINLKFESISSYTNSIVMCAQLRFDEGCNSC